jgi:hypothetical protein
METKQKRRPLSRRSWLPGVAGIVIVYLGVSASPLVPAIGRTHPFIAAMLSPPFFNFSASYSAGDVAGFQIGGNRVDVVSAIRELYGYSGQLVASCTKSANQNAELVVIDNSDRVARLLEQDAICIWVPSRRLSIILWLEGDLLRRVTVTRLTMEII